MRTEKTTQTPRKHHVLLGKTIEKNSRKKENVTKRKFFSSTGTRAIEHRRPQASSKHQDQHSSSRTPMASGEH